jgi:hypothetical protein
LSSPESSPRELVAFAGAVQCAAAHGAINLVLRGRARGGSTELLFSAAGAGALPKELHDVQVSELAGEFAARRFRIDSPELQLEFAARSAQLHCDVAGAFFAAVPPPHVPLRLRVGWWLLLTLLRLPKAERLLRLVRGSR